MLKDETSLLFDKFHEHKIKNKSKFSFFVNKLSHFTGLQGQLNSLSPIQSSPPNVLNSPISSRDEKLGVNQLPGLPDLISPSEYQQTLLFIPD